MSTAMTRFAFLACDHCHRPLALQEVAPDPDPEGEEDRLLCKWCWATLVFRCARRAGLRSEPELSEGSPEEVTA